MKSKTNENRKKTRLKAKQDLASFDAMGKTEESLSEDQHNEAMRLRKIIVLPGNNILSLVVD